MSSRPTNKSGSPEAAWTFLTNHAHVLLCLSRDPTARMRDVANQVGVTERAVQRIVSDLEDAGYLTHSRDGRRNRYFVDVDRHLRHPIEQHQKVATLLGLVDPPVVPAVAKAAPKKRRA